MKKISPQEARIKQYLSDPAVKNPETVQALLELDIGGWVELEPGEWKTSSSNSSPVDVVNRLSGAGSFKSRRTREGGWVIMRLK